MSDAAGPGPLVAPGRPGASGMPAGLDVEKTGVFVGAYAASPAHSAWDARLESEFFDGLDAVPELRGVELPWMGALHPHDDAWLLRSFPRRFDAVLTSIPGTMKRLGTTPLYGLASRDADGRAAALAEAGRIRDAVRRLNDAVGRRAVTAVELHSAPSAGRGDVASLAASIAELSADADTWDGATIAIEHCDAFVPSHQPEKGFLDLTDELAAIADRPAWVGLSINWGRSAIELRDGELVTAHIRQAAASGRLRGLMLSGASAELSPFGGPWVDAHHPMTPSSSFPYGEPSSMLTEDLLRDAIAAAAAVDWLGFKFGWADREAPVEPRVDMIATAAAAVTAASQGAGMRGAAVPPKLGG